MEDTSCRYRMNRRNMLPKFGSSKNPFANPAKSEAGAEINTTPVSGKMETRSLFAFDSAEAAKEIKTPVARPVASVQAPPSNQKAEPPPALAPATVSIDPTPTISSRPAPPFWRNWLTILAKLNPLSWFSRGADGRTISSRGRVGRRPVQAELTLDRVQVVRNDLRDSDLEIVPGKIMGIPSGASPIISRSARPDMSPFGRLAARLTDFERMPL